MYTIAMKQKYTLFNLTCVFICALLGAGIFWQFLSLKRALALSDVNYDEIVSEEEPDQKPDDTKDDEQKEPDEKPADTTTTTDQNTDTPKEDDEKLPPVLKTAYNELQGEHTGVIINLDVPYSSQAPDRIWEEPWQNACEEVSILMLNAYYGRYGLSPMFAKDEIRKMVAWEEEQNWFTSISIEKIATLYKQFFPHGKQPRIIDDPTVAQIKTFLDTGTPVLAVANGRTLPNGWYSDGGPDYHALIIRGYTEDEFITNDPGVNRGRNFTFPISALMNSLHDWNNGNVEMGTPRILVLE